MIGKGELHSIAYDTVEKSLSNMLKTKSEESVLMVIRDVGRYAHMLNTRDVERISKRVSKKLP